MLQAHQLTDTPNRTHNTLGEIDVKSGIDVIASAEEELSILTHYANHQAAFFCGRDGLFLGQADEIFEISQMGSPCHERMRETVLEQRSCRAMPDASA